MPPSSPVQECGPRMSYPTRSFLWSSKTVSLNLWSSYKGKLATLSDLSETGFGKLYDRKLGGALGKRKGKF